MTANQIAYAKYLEESRSNRAQEFLKQNEVRIRQEELAESQRRTNLQIESERRAQDLNVLNVQRQTEASITSAGISASASRYASDISYLNTQSNIKAQEAVRASEVFKNQVGTIISGFSGLLNYAGALAKLV